MINFLIAAWFLILPLLNMQKPDELQQSIDLQHSVIYWKGTKMAGTGYHEGTLHLRSGQLIIKKKELKGGSFEIDMNSIHITDIPAHETVPLAALTKHLKEEFDVAHHPTIKFNITKSNSTHIMGDLTVMGLTKSITLPYRKNLTGYDATLSISRKDWKIGKHASWLENKLVDDLISLRINLILKK